MDLLRAAVSMVPVVGPTVDALDAVSQGRTTGAVMEVCNLVMDIGSMGQSGTARAASRGLVRAAGGRGSVNLAKVGLRTGATAVARKFARYAAKAGKRAAESSVRSVIKTAVKRKVIHKVNQFGAKVGFAVALTAVGNLPGRGETFAQFACSDSKLHAVLAKEVYRTPEFRRGKSVSHPLPAGREEPLSWYTYVGGDRTTGFWYSPADGGHLIMAERGTYNLDPQDMRSNASLAFGLDAAAVSRRARRSRGKLLQQWNEHFSCRRVTLAGHSLGGSIMCFLATSLSDGVPVSAVHAFNAGGLPDLTRSLACATTSVQVHAHCILGDAISAAFLPFAQKTYAKRHGYEHHHSHRLVHFLG